MFARIAVNTKSSKRDDLFTYEIPEEIRDVICVGQLVIIPLGNRSVNGIVIGIEKTKPEFETKKILKIVDETPIVDNEKIELARFISEYYWCGFSQALFAMLPINLRKRKTKILRNDSREAVKDPGHPYGCHSNFQLNSAQEKALEKINNAIDDKKAKTFLLHGVTNSGKTEIYLRACAEALEVNLGHPMSGIPGHWMSGGSGGCIYIVPEIALTPQAINRFEEVFGKDQVALIHSGLSISERLKTWIDIKTGKKNIVVGSRSAIFAPLQNLKIIIVDEEHDLISFKSDQTPRYELHTVAEKLAELSGSVLVFGSATPLVTSYAKVVSGEWEYLSLPDRVACPGQPGGDNSIPPQVKIVDMSSPAHNASHNEAGREGVFSDYLLQALELVLKNKKQALLFLNRRGMASFILCNDCKKVSMCESCDSNLVYHSIDNSPYGIPQSGNSASGGIIPQGKLWCHHCGRKYPVPVKCGVCGGLDFRFLGRGTEKIESEIRKYFPQARIARMDRDTMTSDLKYQEIFEKYKKGEIDILVGTQMIVHGWDIPSVDLAAVISIDESLLMPDYSSEEKVFQLLTQLTGRTGRSNARGMMILQTINPDLAVFENVVKNDYLSFVKRELALREKFSYPPFGRMVKLSLGGMNGDLVEKKAEDMANKLKNLEIKKLKEARVEIVGPISPLVEKKYNRYWKNIILKFVETRGGASKDGKTHGRVSLREELLNLVPKEWAIDIDPLTLF
ncbi:MAG: primosomal protein N' [Patescibacteria group bacterium]|nr:primosomal protein N' [Patescibacteria group bacterium]